MASCGGLASRLQAGEQPAAGFQPAPHSKASERGPVSDRVVFDNVSRFYGEVLGVNRVTLSIPAGITSLVGPNGSGKTTLMNLIAGLVRPTRGEIRVLDIAPNDPSRLCRAVGYATQFDSFPKGLTGFEFVTSFLRLFGFDRAR